MEHPVHNKLPIFLQLMRELMTKKNTLELHQLQIKEMVNNNSITSSLLKKIAGRNPVPDYT